MIKKKEIFKSMNNSIKKILNNEKKIEEKLLDICKLLNDNIPYYNWVGFYLVDDSKNELILGPYIGEPTEHIIIPFGKGICGQAAEKKETFIIQDVKKETNYLSCSLNVNSEIVVPIFKDGKMVGQLDIDSHDISPFDDEDRIFLENICINLSELF